MSQQARLLVASVDSARTTHCGQRRQLITCARHHITHRKAGMEKATLGTTCSTAARRAQQRRPPAVSDRCSGGSTRQQQHAGSLILYPLIGLTDCMLSVGEWQGRISAACEQLLSYIHLPSTLLPPATSDLAISLAIRSLVRPLNDSWLADDLIFALSLRL